MEVISRSGDTLEVDDLYEGRMTIPYFDIPTSTLKPDDFSQENGVITYNAGESTVGIQVNSQKGEIDWTQVAQSGVDFAMVRVGWRQYDSGRIMLDETFEANITGATQAGLPVGVYFFSKAITDAEAEEEATFVLEQIRDYQISYPVAVIWEYDRKDDGTIDESRRTVRCNGEQVTGFIDTFCGKMSAAGYDAAYLCDKTMATRAWICPASPATTCGIRSSSPPPASGTPTPCGSTPTRERCPASPRTWTSPSP